MFHCSLVVYVLSLPRTAALPALVHLCFAAVHLVARILFLVLHRFQQLVIIGLLLTLFWRLRLFLRRLLFVLLLYLLDIDLIHVLVLIHLVLFQFKLRNSQFFAPLVVFGVNFQRLLEVVDAVGIVLTVVGKFAEVVE